MTSSFILLCFNGGGSGWEVREEREREAVNWVPGSERVWVVSCDRYRSSHWQARSHWASQSPHLTTKSVRLYSLQCYLLLRDAIKINLQPVSEKTHLSSSPPVLLCVLKHFHTCAVFVFRLRVCPACWPRVTRAPVVCRPIIITSSCIQMSPETLVGFAQGWVIFIQVLFSDLFSRNQWEQLVIWSHCTLR